MSVFSTWAQFTIYNASNSGLSSNNCWYVNQDQSGKVWVATQNGGAFVYNGTAWTNYKTTNSGIGANYVTPIAFEPGTTNTWLGTYSSNAGISRFNGSAWSTYNTSNSGLPYDDVLAIDFDAQGNKWIGTRGGGVAKYNGTTWTVFNTFNSAIPSDIIYSLEIDNAGNVWVGTALSGLAKYDGANWTIYNSSNSSLPDDDVYSLKFNTQTNSMWIGTNGGVAVIKNNVWTIYKSGTTANFPDNYIRGIAHSASSGNTFIATGNGGIGVFDGYTWRSYNTSNSNLPSNQVWSVNLGFGNEVWASTWGSGIVKFTDTPSGIEDLKESSLNTNVFPNPGRTKVTFVVDSKRSDKAFIKILNALGQEVETKIIELNPGENTFILNVENYNPGLYNYLIKATDSSNGGKLIVD
ncbi:MAG: T9SS type A sorting domain-containing protein [Bacteroidetes bacterium]|nr:T9SS type A sorting domain-containing protein [Bacteroidota bacterium]